MLAIGKFENKAVILAISFLVISIIGFIDYLTTAELTLSYFYIIPISIHALYKGTTKFLVIINSVFGCLVWTLVIISNNYYSNGFYTVWNALIILAFFLTSGLLLWTVKKKYKENQELLSHLARLNEEKNKFIGIAAHDMKNPVSTIHSFSEILLSRYQKELNPDLLKIIGYIREISHDALILLGNLLNISVIESGKINIKYKMQDYIEFLKKSIYLNQIIADQKEIVIKLETGEHKFFIKFDEHYLSEVVNNLLSNAIKFSSPKSEVLIKVTKTEKNSMIL